MLAKDREELADRADLDHRFDIYNSGYTVYK